MCEPTKGAATGGPRLICITGLDGSGKTTQVGRLAERLERGGKLRVAVATIWDMLLDPAFKGRTAFRSPKEVDAFLQLLCPTARMLFLDHCFVQALELARRKDADLVLVNGYWYKYYATEVAHGGDASALLAPAAVFPEPDQTFYLRLPPEDAFERKARLSGYETGFAPERTREAFLEFQRKALAAFEAVAAGRRWVWLDAQAPIEELTETMLAEIGAHSQRPPGAGRGEGRGASEPGPAVIQAGRTEAPSATRPLILVNRQSNAGKGGERWDVLEPALRSQGLDFEAQVTTSAEDAAQRLERGLAAGYGTIIAAGGDGTVNGVLNALMDPQTDRPRADVVLGAIGLGSSNDFHKPFAPERTVGDVPVCLDSTGAQAIDLGKAVLHGADGETRVRYFALNASMGLVAEGNAYFNASPPTLTALKRHNVEVAIAYTALVNLLSFEPIDIWLQLDDGPAEALRVVSLGVVKKVHFAGGMRYDTPVTAADGLFDVNIMEEMSRLRVARTLAGLYQGRFKGRPYTRCLRAARVKITPSRPMHFELDGEVEQVVAAEVSVLPAALRLCR